MAIDISKYENGLKEGLYYVNLYRELDEVIRDFAVTRNKTEFYRMMAVVTEASEDDRTYEALYMDDIIKFLENTIYPNLDDVKQRPAYEVEDQLRKLIIWPLADYAMCQIICG